VFTYHLSVGSTSIVVLKDNLSNNLAEDSLIDYFIEVNSFDKVLEVVPNFIII
jgi:hypothetical protein